MADVHLGQGMVRPGAWSVGGVVHRHDFSDPKDTHRFVPEIWSPAAIEAFDQRMTLASAIKGRGKVSDQQALWLAGLTPMPWGASSQGRVFTGGVISRG